MLLDGSIVYLPLKVICYPLFPYFAVPNEYLTSKIIWKLCVPCVCMETTDVKMVRTLRALSQLPSESLTPAWEQGYRWAYCKCHWKQDVPVSMSQKANEGPQDADNNILLTFMSLQLLSLNKTQNQIELCFFFWFCFVLFSLTLKQK